MSILKLKILSYRTSPFGFFFWELLARVGRDHSTTVLSSAAQVGFKDDPGIKWHLDTENLRRNQTRVKSICCGGGLKELKQGKGFRNLWSLRQFLPF